LTVGTELSDVHVPPLVAVGTGKAVPVRWSVTAISPQPQASAGWGTRQPVQEGQEDVLDPPVLEIGQHLEPELGALGLFDPKSYTSLSPLRSIPMAR
jgi:hypothetical protein